MSEAAPVQKADFGGIYNQSDPRAYFATLAPIAYEIPQHGADVFQGLLAASTGSRPTGHPATVLDVCCSYGVGGILLTTDLRLDDLYAHYGGSHELSTSRLTEEDGRLFSGHRVPDAPRVVGIDVAERAVEYAVRTGACDAAYVADLETTDPSQDLIEELSDVDLVTTTGGIGYVGAPTFRRLAEHVPAQAWVAAFCVRTYDYGPVADVLDERGLRTERSAATFAQRRFLEPAEQEWAVAEVTARGLDPAGKEGAGSFHAELYLSRPADQVAARPLNSLLPGLA